MTSTNDQYEKKFAGLHVGDRIRDAHRATLHELQDKSTDELKTVMESARSILGQRQKDENSAQAELELRLLKGKYTALESKFKVAQANLTEASKVLSDQLSRTRKEYADQLDRFTESQGAIAEDYKDHMAHIGSSKDEEVKEYKVMIRFLGTFRVGVDAQIWLAERRGLRERITELSEIIVKLSGSLDDDDEHVPSNLVDLHDQDESFELTDNDRDHYPDHDVPEISNPDVDTAVETDDQSNGQELDTNFGHDNDHFESGDDFENDDQFEGEDQFEEDVSVPDMAQFDTYGAPGLALSDVEDGRNKDLEVSSPSLNDEVIHQDLVNNEQPDMNMSMSDILEEHEEQPEDLVEDDMMMTSSPRYEFLVSGKPPTAHDPDCGTTIQEVHSDLIEAVDNVIAKIQTKTNPKFPTTWSYPTKDSRCVHTRLFKKYSKDRERGVKKGAVKWTACRTCLKNGVPCLMVGVDVAPVVLPLPRNERGEASPYERAYYVR